MHRFSKFILICSSTWKTGASHWFYYRNISRRTALWTSRVFRNIVAKCYSVIKHDAGLTGNLLATMKRSLLILSSVYPKKCKVLARKGCLIQGHRSSFIDLANEYKVRFCKSPTIPENKGNQQLPKVGNKLQANWASHFRITPCSSYP